ncbi:TAAR6 protein, partial [Amia calva]|nr:TAAR6 protein [Amia calva]
VYVVMYISAAVVVMLTVCGNLLVIISISHFKQLHTPTNLLLLSLAVAGLLMGVTVMPLCLVSFCLNHVACIATDRYLAVCDPLLYSTKITKNDENKSKKITITSERKAVFAEFNRIAYKNLQRDFFEALDVFSSVYLFIICIIIIPCFCILYILTSDVTARCSVVLRGIPILLGDDCSEFYRTCFTMKSNEDFVHIPVGVLTVIPEDTFPPLQLIQNSVTVTHLIFSLPRFAYATPLLCSLHWLLIPARIQFKTLTLIFSDSSCNISPFNPRKIALHSILSCFLHY